MENGKFSGGHQVVFCPGNEVLGPQKGRGGILYGRFGETRGSILGVPPRGVSYEKRGGGWEFVLEVFMQ